MKEYFNASELAKLLDVDVQQFPGGSKKDSLPAQYASETSSSGASLLHRTRS